MTLRRSVYGGEVHGLDVDGLDLLHGVHSRRGGVGTCEARSLDP